MKFTNDFRPWLTEAQEALKNTQYKRVLFYAQNDPLSGLLGFSNCLMREPDCGHSRFVRQKKTKLLYEGYYLASAIPTIVYTANETILTFIFVGAASSWIVTHHLSRWITLFTPTNWRKT